MGIMTTGCGICPNARKFQSEKSNRDNLNARCPPRFAAAGETCILTMELDVTRGVISGTA